MSKTGIFASALAFLASAAAAADGWSEWRTIVRIESNWSVTTYLLDGGSLDCNGSADGYPKYELRESDTQQGAEQFKHKKAILLAAYTTGDKVKLRCEGGRLTDFQTQKN